MNPPEFISAEPCPVHLIDAPPDCSALSLRDEVILVAISAIRETTSREQAIAALEALLGCTPSDWPGERAFLIADDAMFTVLSSNCVPGDTREHATVFGLIDASGSEVNKLSEADPQIVEAFEWLRLRGYVELATDGLGDHVIVVRRPGEQ